MVVGDDKNPPLGDEAAGQEKLLSRALDAFTLPQTSTSNGSTPALPPAMAAMANKSADEILSDLNKTPLFMTTLEENDEIEAFKALAYEGPPAEVALNFKEQGNECFKAGKWADAKEFYSKGIAVLQGEQRKRSQETNKKDTPTPEEREELPLLETLLLNRAASHLSLQNYRSCTLDCASVLRLNPTNLKAHYRSTKALLQLQKLREADDLCARALALSPTDASLLSLAQQILQKNTALQAKKSREQALASQKAQEAYVLNAALKARGIVTRRTAQPPEMEDARVALVPDASSPESTLVFPTVLLYPLHLQSDFIPAFAETETLGERLSVVLGERPGWDAEGEYVYGVGGKGVECYMETLKGGLIKVGRKVRLLEVLGGGKVEVVDQVVRIFVLPKKRAAGWVEEFKAKKAAEKVTG